KMGYAGCWRHRRKDGTLIDVDLKLSPVSFKGRPASLTMANDVTERKQVEHRDAVLSQLGQRLSSASSPAEAAAIIREVADELFVWDIFTLDLYSEDLDQVCSILNVDSDDQGRRFEIPLENLGKDPSPLVRRVIKEGSELILHNEPLSRSDAVTPI